MASTYLSRTNSSAGSGTKFTISTWLKKGTNTSGVPRIMEFYHSSAYYISLRFRDDDSNELEFYSESNGGAVRLKTNRSFRDLSAWYHIVLAVDTTEATADDRQKLYINGVQETSFLLRTNPSSSEDLGYNTSSATNYVGRKWENSDYFNGSMAHFHFIDGTAYDADTFGETDSTTGIWKPKTAPSVTYGTNGFFLKFENSGSMGTDSSGNDNDFTVNGTMTQTIDTPSNVFATLNPLEPESSNITFSNGNTSQSTSSTSNDFTMSTLAASQGKYYIETKWVSGTATGSFIGLSTIRGKASVEAYLLRLNGTLTNLTASGTAPSGFSAGDIIGVAIDLDNNRIQFYIDGVAEGDYCTFTRSETNEPLQFVVGNDAHSCNTNFGNGYFGTTAVSSAQNPDDGIGIFEYDVPAGYRALCTKSINAEEYS